jgi:metal-responsive CopG/Arc/MetJ family transcriptional regulator
MKRRISIFLEESQLKQLQTISDKTGAPMSELIRRAIDAYTKKRKEKS